MNKEEFIEFMNTLSKERNEIVEEHNRRIEYEHGFIEGIDCMGTRIANYLRWKNDDESIQEDTSYMEEDLDDIENATDEEATEGGR